MYQAQISYPALFRAFSQYLLLLVAALPSLLWADDDIRVMPTVEFINMHTEPGRGFPVFHVIERNEVIILIKSKNNWIKARTEKGITGWIHRRDIVNTIGVNGEEVQLGIPSFDDYTNRRWEIGFGAGEFDNVPSLGLRGGYRFTNNLMLEMQLTQATGSQSKNELMLLGLVHQPFPNWRFSPYFTLASGTIKTTTRSQGIQLDDSDDEVFLVGTGMYAYLSSRFILKLELNQYTSLPSENFNTKIDELKLGFSAFF